MAKFHHSVIPLSRWHLLPLQLKVWKYKFLLGLRDVLKSVVDPATGQIKGLHMPLVYLAV